MKKYTLLRYLIAFLAIFQVKQEAAISGDSLTILSNTTSSERLGAATFKTNQGTDHTLHLLDNTLITFSKAFKCYEKSIVAIYGKNACSFGYYYCRAKKVYRPRLAQDLLRFDAILLPILSKFIKKGGIAPGFLNLNKQQLKSLVLEDDLSNSVREDTCKVLDTIEEIADHYYYASFRNYLQTLFLVHCSYRTAESLLKSLKKILIFRSEKQLKFFVIGISFFTWYFFSKIIPSRPLQYDKDNKESKNVLMFSYIIKLNLAVYYLLIGTLKPPYDILPNFLTPIIDFLVLYNQYCRKKISLTILSKKIKQVEFIQKLSPHLKKEKQKLLAVIFPDVVVKLIFELTGEYPFSLEEWKQLTQQLKEKLIQYNQQVKTRGLVTYIKDGKKRETYYQVKKYTYKKNYYNIDYEGKIVMSVLPFIVASIWGAYWCIGCRMLFRR